ncbi:MAG: Asp23/Gls24 family envelope stress response protein [Haloechinothrix sp.]
MSERGTTTVTDRALAHIAAHAVTEIAGVGGAAPRMRGVSVGGADLERSAAVSARVRGDTASLAVRLSVAYPASVRQATDLVREHLVTRTGALTGLAIDRVDITVTALHGDHDGRRRVE